jgi:hypothetical protein
MKRIFTIFCFFVAASPFWLDATKGQYWTIEMDASGEPAPLPWFTGPLITPSPRVVPVGFFNLEPYVNYSITSSRFDQDWHAVHLPHSLYTLNPQPTGLQIGLTDWMDCQINCQFFWNRLNHRSAVRLGDLSFGLDFQLLRDQPHHPWPAIKLTIRESFPTGKYHRLNPLHLGLDGVGSGSFATLLGITSGRFFPCWGEHYLDLRLGLTYTIPSHVHVRGFNAYGGGYGTDGSVSPGKTLSAVLGLEFNLTRSWALACDLQNIYSERSSFKGKPGILPDQKPASVGFRSSDLLAIAPAIEYNWNASVGCIGGLILDLTGRNTGRSTTFLFAVNIFGPFKKAEPKPTPYWIHPNAPIPTP